MRSTSALLQGLSGARHAHSLEVGRKAAAASAQQRLVDPAFVADLVTAAQLHDIGYRPDLALIGFHPLDGATALRQAGFSSLTCHLVAHHTGADREAWMRGIPASAFTPFAYPEDEAAPLRAVLAWADLTTSPSGRTVTVEERLTEILTRYPSDDVVHRNTRAELAWLTAAGQHPLGALDA